MADSSMSPTRPGSRSVSSLLGDGTDGHAACRREPTRRGRQPTGLWPFAGSLSGGASAQLLLHPRLEVVTAVEDAAAEAEAAGAGAQVAPVPEGGHRSAEQLGGLGDGEQFGLAAGGVLGHGWARGGRGGCGSPRGEGRLERGWGQPANDGSRNSPVSLLFPWS